MRAGLFPGQGLDAAAVLGALPRGCPRLDEANEILGYDLRRRVDQAARSSRPGLPTELAQPAIFVAGIASFEDQTENGATFDCFLGHSLGEYTALVAAGSIPFSHGLKLVAARGRAMQRAASRVRGGMAALINCSLDDVESICRETGVTLANDNSPTQAVIAGEEDALAEVAQVTRGLGGRTVLLPVDGPFHTVAMQPAAGELARALDRTPIRSPRVPVVSNVTAAPYRAPGEIRKLLGLQMTSRVRFRECVAWLLTNGVTELVDLGPSNVVGRLAHATARERQVARA